MNADTHLWDILICSIPHRDVLLTRLLAELDAQLAGCEDIQVTVCRDNLEFTYGWKMQELLNYASAKYVSWIDDDDWIAEDYIPTLRAVLLTGPSYVGYKVEWSVDGVPVKPVEHSLRYDGWDDDEKNERGLITRDISEKNPMLRKVAMCGRWAGGWRAERGWADQVRATGMLRKEDEVWVDQVMYYYRERLDSNFRAGRQPLPFPVPDLPDYPWLNVITLGGHPL